MKVADGEAVTPRASLPAYYPVLYGGVPMSYTRTVVVGGSAYFVKPVLKARQLTVGSGVTLLASMKLTSPALMETE